MRTDLLVVAGILGSTMILISIVSAHLSKSQELPVSARDVLGYSRGIEGRCRLWDFNAINSDGINEAVVRFANCPGILEQGNEYYAVFVHKVGEPNTNENLAFLYEPGDITNDLLSPRPSVVWSGGHRLGISATGVLEDIVEQKTHVGKTEIKYSLGQVQSRDDP
jgi:hypothetical protein